MRLGSALSELPGAGHPKLALRRPEPLSVEGALVAIGGGCLPPGDEPQMEIEPTLLRCRPMIPGRATAEGTLRFRARFEGVVATGHFRQMGDLWLSSIGLGTYLGAPDDTTDRSYEQAIIEALRQGCNVFDTAINYRHQRSERALGRALARAFKDGVAQRDEVFVSTKAGFLPFDQEPPSDPGGYLRSVYLESGLVSADDLAAGSHALAAAFLADQLERSRNNLTLETIDLFFLHNPESQLEERSTKEGWKRIDQALDWLAEPIAHGTVANVGLATWNGLRVPSGSRGHLALSETATTANTPNTPSSAASIAALQLPLNLAMPEALLVPTQEFEGVNIPPIVLAKKQGLAVFTSASVHQGRLAGELPREIQEAFGGLTTDTQRALQFARSAPGVTTALVGMSRVEHVIENLEVARSKPAGVEAYRRIFGSA